MQTPPVNIKPFPKEDFETEELLKTASKTSNITYAIVAYNYWMEEMFDWVNSGKASPAESGRTQFLTTAAEGRMAYVSKEDYARACAAALARSDIEANVKYDVSGPEAIHFPRLVSRISTFVGTHIQLVSV